MADKFAVRNGRLCTKDCLCIYVCPNGACDTENSVIDADKCIGCGACVSACPSGAIYMVPRTMPPQQPKEEKLAGMMHELILSKAEQEMIADALPGDFANAVVLANRYMAEDLCRESGYMLPQSGNSKAFLESLREEADVPQDLVEDLLAGITFNEEAPQKKEAAPVERWQCSVCGYIHEGPLPEGFTCPVCKQPASVFKRIDVEPAPTEKWQCSICGYIHEGPLPEGFTCPVCKQPASVFKRIE